MFEDWRIKDGNWEIEMWRFVLGPDGNAVDVVHRTLGEDFSGTTLTEEWDRGVTVQDERAQTALRAMFDRWAKFSPQ